MLPQENSSALKGEAVSTHFGRISGSSGSSYSDLTEIGAPLLLYTKPLYVD